MTNSNILWPTFMNLHSFSIELEVLVSSLTFIITTKDIKFIA